MLDYDDGIQINFGSATLSRKLYDIFKTSPNMVNHCSQYASLKTFI